ncbi:protein NDR1-like [Nicotiana tabacum]|uniref:Protein NDR1-like n=1 Tax=Nicotiana tabacum TaxID=4097 RepID=A0AC58T3Y6_TOBAC
MNHRRISKPYDFDLYCWFFQVAAVLSLISLVMWLCLIPRNPIFTLVDFSFLDLNVKNSSLLGDNNSVILNLEIFNPNKGMSIYYNDINFTLNYNGLVVGRSSTQGIYQGHKNIARKEVQMYNVDELFWQGIGNGSIDFVVRFETKVKLKIFKWRTKLRQINYVAYMSNMTMSSNGTISGESLLNCTPKTLHF